MKNILLLCAALLLTTGTARSQEPETLVKQGEQVPAFQVTMFDGSTVDIENLKGKVVLLNFWATWCPPCRAELKRVQKEIVDRFAGEDFVFLPISRGEKKETVADFRKKNGYTFPMGLDSETSVFKLFATGGIPRNFLIDREGKIVAAEVGYTPESFEELINKIAETLKNK